MQNYNLTIISKNNKSATSVTARLLRAIYIFKKHFQKKKKKKIITILKSPHVNKNAQEQFEYVFFSHQFNMYSPAHIYVFFNFIKKTRLSLFSDVKFKLKFIINPILLKKKQANIFNPNNFILSFYKNCINSNKTIMNSKKKKIKLNKNKKKNTSFYLKTFDIYGELI
jgi:ribosomal protein S10